MKNSSAPSRYWLRLLPVFAVLFVPTLAQAHPGGDHTHSFSHGFAHPFSGLDHLCAMLAVGLYAAQRGGSARWALPLTFVAFMAIGGALGMNGAQFSFTEQAIAASVLVLGIVIAAAARLPMAAVLPAIAGFALFHGLAHGAEMPATAAGSTFAVGFLIATVSLHLAGLAAGMFGAKCVSATTVRYAGGAITACGLYLCLV